MRHRLSMQFAALSRRWRPRRLIRRAAVLSQQRRASLRWTARRVSGMTAAAIIAACGVMASTYHSNKGGQDRQDVLSAQKTAPIFAGALLTGAPFSLEGPDMVALATRATRLQAAATAGGQLSQSLMAGSAVPEAARRLTRCWNHAARRYHVNPLLLIAIGTVESRLHNNTVNINADGSRDLGLMQINSIHLPRLEQQGITSTMLLEDPCVSIITGAEILAQNVKRHGNTWNAVGAYNAGSRADRQARRTLYANKVQRAYGALLSKVDPDNGPMQGEIPMRIDTSISLRAGPVHPAIRHPAG
ncbi:lytic transglycosylase domain-containing protein [Robbsia andropogonis]|uniref:lytic transglycosylase domain-containing protein n=1 Tax=Robbsia andropogonis TaxID=28092 RepID=UPI00209EF7F5|nr:lytic transglycosylase domain-containing protein [Robbsia andropogonis]MCP1121056.1 lytic transglycosylase domain-containing protein [Robbsia andropogonis]MCP1130849.1 lytic transglycosylase domain-containing protein [Robbsia andropogonis]